MGYSEMLCVICGVSFNLSRIRRREEPTTAAWDYDNTEGSYVRVDGAYSFEQCGKNAGCMYHNRLDGTYKSAFPPGNRGNDEMQVQGTSQEDEDEDTVADMFLEDDSAGTFEHIAGPGCNASGYNGHKISVEEMRFCMTFQCLVRKQPDFEPASDDTEFEKDPRFPMYLSGLCDQMRDREMANVDDMYPMRHNMQDHAPDHIYWDQPDEENSVYSMPFHPACLEIFQRCSRQREGQVDMLALVNWWHRRGPEMTFEGPLWATGRGDDIGRLAQQWWLCETGTEYVAAHPFLIPGLATVIADCTMPQAVDGNHGAFDLPQNTNFDPSPGDLFAALPAELRLSILSCLSNEDISNLRLTSRSFRQLPVSLWHTIILREMPWFWEAWPVGKQGRAPYPFLTTTTERELRAKPDVNRDPVPVPDVLDFPKTNWCQLYHAVDRGIYDTDTLKGLANRRRIWADCERIVEDIKNLPRMWRDLGE